MDLATTEFPQLEHGSFGGRFFFYVPPAYVAMVVNLTSIAIGVLTVTGNLLIIVSLSTIRALNDKSAPMVMSLAFADFCYGAFQIVEDSVSASCLQGCNHLNDVMRGNSFIRDCVTFSSMLHLLVIGVDRCVSIVHPLRYESLITPSVTRGMLVGCWVTSVCLVVPQFTLELWSPQYWTYWITVRCVIYVLISCCLVNLYGKMGCIACHQRRRIVAQGVELPPERIPKATKILGTVIGCYTMLYFPAFVSLIWMLSGPSLYKSYELQRAYYLAPQITRLFPLLNSAANVFIYSFMNSKHRRVYRQLLSCHKIHDIRLETTNHQTSAA